MFNIEGPDGDVGVIVGRFQTPVLTEGHRTLIESVKARHKKFMIMLGVAPIPGTKNNPLDYTTRSLMISRDYPSVATIPINDLQSDDAWSKKLDSMLRSIFPTSKIVLYGSRDSFISKYTGKLATAKLESNVTVSATDMREASWHNALDSEDFRVGVCYGIANQYPRTNSVVDVAITRDEKNQVLFGKKPGEKLYRFIGGFVDPTDKSLQAAVDREVGEETGVDVGDIIFIGSVKIDDWRYKGTSQTIMSSFFEAKYLCGHAKGDDDIASVDWVDTGALDYCDVNPVHHDLLELFFAHKNIKRERRPLGEPFEDANGDMVRQTINA